MQPGDIILPHQVVFHVVVDSLPEDEGRVPVVQLPGGDPELAVVSAHVLEGGGVPGVVIVDPVLPLPAQQGDVFTVDHHHVVPAVSHRVVHGLVTALEDLGQNKFICKYLTQYRRLYLSDGFG